MEYTIVGSGGGFKIYLFSNTFIKWNYLCLRVLYFDHTIIVDYTVIIII